LPLKTHINDRREETTHASERQPASLPSTMPIVKKKEIRRAHHEKKEEKYVVLAQINAPIPVWPFSPPVDEPEPKSEENVLVAKKEP
jgi:hypothetical protein